MKVQDVGTFEFSASVCTPTIGVDFLSNLARRISTRTARDSLPLLDTLELWVDTLSDSKDRLAGTSQAYPQYKYHVRDQALHLVQVGRHKCRMQAVLHGSPVAGCLAYVTEHTRLQKINHITRAFNRKLLTLAPRCVFVCREQLAQVHHNRALGRPYHRDQGQVVHLIQWLCSQNKHQDALKYLSYEVSQNDNLFLYKLLGDLQNLCGYHTDAAHTFATVALRARWSTPIEMSGMVKRSMKLIRAIHNPWAHSSCSDSEPVSAHQFIECVTPKQALQCRGFLNSSQADPISEREESLTIAGNCIQNLAKLLQEGKLDCQVATPSDIFVLYVLSLSLNPSASPANNAATVLASMACTNKRPGLRALAQEYYIFALGKSPSSFQIYTNLGSLHRDQGDINKAVSMFQKALSLNATSATALVKLGSAYKDQGRVVLAAKYYERALDVDSSLVEAIGGLSLCHGPICNWKRRGGCSMDVYVDGEGDLVEHECPGWLTSLVKMVQTQVLQFDVWTRSQWSPESTLSEAEQTTRATQRQWYMDIQSGCFHDNKKYQRPVLPPFVRGIPLCSIQPFHALTLALCEYHIERISRSSSLHVSVSTLQSEWLPLNVYPPPSRPEPQLRVGYVSSDFADHPLSHLMQSVFGMHDRSRVLAICYATSIFDMSSYRVKIETESYLFRDVSMWTTQQVVEQIVHDNVHVLVNLNGFSRGARNDIFAARPCPIQISMMGFPGLLRAGWCDYTLADCVSTGAELSPVHREKIIHMPHSFFCCDHRQSYPSHTYEHEVLARKSLRKQVFGTLPEDAFLMCNLSQSYKIDPMTFRSWLRVLQQLPRAFLWLLQFPPLSEDHLRYFALRWTKDPLVVQRILFTPVVDKTDHVLRTRICDLFIDTPGCNAHTTAVDVLWGCSPVVTWSRHSYKMSSRMAASIVLKAFPATPQGQALARRLITFSFAEYEQRIVELAGQPGVLEEMRRTLFHERTHGRLFDTARWVREAEQGYWHAWNDYLEGRHEDIYIQDTTAHGAMVLDKKCTI